MKKLMIAALAASTVAYAAPASAAVGDVTGTITINGSVASKCTVIDSGGSPSSSFAATVNMGELSGTDGKLLASSTLANTFNTGGINTAAMSFRIVCTTATPGVSVTANPIVISGGGAPAIGYDNTVNYQANAAFTLVGGSQTVSDLSSAAGATTASLTGRLAGGTSNNLTITADTFSTPNSGVLTAGSYSGSIAIVITPS